MVDYGERMEARQALFEVVVEASRYLVIRDVGDWNEQLTITNDAEGVVRRLGLTGMIHGGMRLFYYDSGGELDELVFRQKHGGPCVFLRYQYCPVQDHRELEVLAEHGAALAADNPPAGSKRG